LIESLSLISTLSSGLSFFRVDWYQAHLCGVIWLATFSAYLTFCWAWILFVWPVAMIVHTCYCHLEPVSLLCSNSSLESGQVDSYST